MDLLVTWWWAGLNISYSCPYLHGLICLLLNLSIAYLNIAAKYQHILAFQSIVLAIGKSVLESGLRQALCHTCFICEQRCKWWSHRPKLTLPVFSDVKPIIYFCKKKKKKICDHNADGLMSISIDTSAGMHVLVLRLTVLWHAPVSYINGMLFTPDSLSLVCTKQLRLSAVPKNLYRERYFVQNPLMTYIR